MRINIYIVAPIIHYVPLYIALHRLDQGNNNINIEYITTKHDKKTIEEVYYKYIKDDEINIFLTSISDLDDRLITQLKFDEKERLDFYKRFCLWYTFIDRIPINIIGRKGNPFRLTEGIRIGCYPSGSTVHWFLDEYVDKNKSCNIIEYEFGSEDEFVKLKNNEIDFAISLQPWKLTNDNFQKLTDIPAQPFGFTCIFSDISTINISEKKNILLELTKLINNEIGNIYSVFEDDAYASNIKRDAVKKKKEFIRELVLINKPLFFSDNEDIPELVKSINWLSRNRIWAYNAVDQLCLRIRDIRSALNIIEENKKRVSERQATFNDIWHNINHFLGTVRDITYNIENALQNYVPNYFSDTEKASEKLAYIRNLMELTRNLDYMNKKGGYFYDKSGLMRPNIKSNIKEINLFNFIESILKDFKKNIDKYYADTIRPTDGVYKMLKAKLNDLYDIKKLDQSFNITIETATFYVMLVDILANATKYACDEERGNNPSVKIWSVSVTENNTEIELHIRNERGICFNDWEIWMKDSSNRSRERHFGLGIQLSKSILDFYKIKYSIPESCVIEKQGDYTELIITLGSHYTIPNYIE